MSCYCFWDENCIYQSSYAFLVHALELSAYYCFVFFVMYRHPFTYTTKAWLGLLNSWSIYQCCWFGFYMWFPVFCLSKYGEEILQTLVLDWLLKILMYWSLFILFGGVLFCFNQAACWSYQNLFIDEVSVFPNKTEMFHAVNILTIVHICLSVI